MRTNIDIDDRLMQATIKATGAPTKKSAVEAAMKLAVQLHRQGEAVRKLRGLGWEGNLDEMRESRIPQPQRSRQKPARARASAA